MADELLTLPELREATIKFFLNDQTSRVLGRESEMPGLSSDQLQGVISDLMDARKKEHVNATA